eukprot:scaffold104674_cov34-Phaeocystis_antarctica.AAC.1
MQTPVGWPTKVFKTKGLIKGTKAFKADPGRIKAPRLQPYVSGAATLCVEAAALCASGCRGCDPVYERTFSCMV